jgi:hypothetical protein
MRTSKDILERINGTYQYFREREDTADERYNTFGRKVGYFARV